MRTKVRLFLGLQGHWITIWHQAFSYALLWAAIWMMPFYFALEVADFRINGIVVKLLIAACLLMFVIVASPPRILAAGIVAALMALLFNISLYSISLAGVATLCGLFAYSPILLLYVALTPLVLLPLSPA